MASLHKYGLRYNNELSIKQADCLP